MRQHALSRGYAITTIRSKADKYVYRGGTYHGRINALEGTRRRLTKTRRIGCPFQLYGKKIPTSEKWELQVRNPSHNHEAEDSMIGHPSAHKFTDEQLQI